MCCQRKRNSGGTLKRRWTFSNQLDSFQSSQTGATEEKTDFRLPASGCVKALPGKAFHRVAPGIVFEATMRSPLLGGAWGGGVGGGLSQSEWRPGHSRVKPKMYCRSLLRLAWGRNVLLSSSVVTRFSLRSFRTCGRKFTAALKPSGNHASLMVKEQARPVHLPRALWTSSPCSSPSSEWHFLLEKGRLQRVSSAYYYNSVGRYSFLNLFFFFCGNVLETRIRVKNSANVFSAL